MSNPPKMSRRDWFRLRKPRQNKMLTETESSVAQDGLSPIEHPVNHDGMDLAELPPMREAVLAADQVSNLFADISQLATDVMLMQRATGAQRASAARATSSEQLAFARTAILEGQLPRLQIRYRWQDTLWIDTLAAQPDGYRLVRIAHQSHPSDGRTVPPRHGHPKRVPPSATDHDVS